MTSDSRVPTAYPRPAVPTDADPARGDFEQVSDSRLIQLISRGNVPAFVALFDRTSAAAHAEVVAALPGGVPAFPGGAPVSEIFAASYVEVWWLAGCRPTPEVDVPTWITGIVRRRIAEARRGIAPRGSPAVLPGPRPTYAELELAALLRRPVDRLWQQ